MLGASAWCFTETKKKGTEFSFYWKIGNFHEKMEKEGQGGLDSSPFNVDLGEVTTTWHLNCWPKNTLTGVGLYLEPLNDAAFNKKVSFSFEVIGKGHRQVKKTLLEQSFSRVYEGKGFPELVSHEELRTVDNKLLPEDCLNILCRLEFSESEEEVTTSGTSSPLSTMESQLEQEEEACMVLVEHLHTGELSDVEVLCGGRTFNCHRIILATKSSVLRAAFQHNMKEKKTGKYTIEGIDPETVEDMLIHIYGGKIEGMENKAEKLLAAADQYDLKHLKLHCEEHLVKSLDITNCLDRLILADLHSTYKLKPLVLKFLVQNSKGVVAQDDWEEKLIAFPKLFAEIFKEMVSSPHNIKN